MRARARVHTLCVPSGTFVGVRGIFVGVRICVFACVRVSMSAYVVSDVESPVKVDNTTIGQNVQRELGNNQWLEEKHMEPIKAMLREKFSHFSQVLDNNPAIKEIGCGYQNRNAVVSNAYLDLAVKRHVKITQKYFVPGHTQMECDSMRSTIERKLGNDIFVPHDYIVLMETARIRPSPYKVRQLDHSNFMKMSVAYITSIRPGKKAGDATVHALRAIEYRSDGVINFKLDLADGVRWELLPQRIRIPQEPFGWVRLFDARQPIKLRKFKYEVCDAPVLPSFHGHTSSFAGVRMVDCVKR